MEPSKCTETVWPAVASDVVKHEINADAERIRLD